MRKSFFSKAIFAVGVMASALALSSVAVFATITNEENSDATLEKTGVTISSTDYKYGKCEYDSTNKKAVYTWDFTNFAESGATIYGLNYKNLQANSSMAKFSSKGGYLQFTTNGRFDVSINSGNKSTAKINIGTKVDESKSAEGFAFSDNYNATATGLPGGSYFIYRGDGSDTYIKTLTITVYNVTSTSCAVSAPSGYTGDFTLSVAEGKNIEALVEGDTVTVNYSGYDYAIDEFTYTVKASDVEATGVVLTVPDDKKHALTYNWTVPALPSDSYTGSFAWANEKGTSNTLSYTGDNNYNLKTNYYDWSLDTNGVIITEDGDYTYNVTVAPTADWFDEKANFSAGEQIDFANCSGNYIGESLVCDNKIKILTPHKTDASKGVVIDGTSKTFNDVNGSEVTKSKNIQTGGTGSETTRAISFIPNGNGQVYIYVSSNGSNTRKIFSNGSQIGSITGTTPSLVSLDVTAGNEYVIYSPDGTVRFYYIQSTVGFNSYSPASASENVYTNAGVYANNNHYYIVSVVDGSNLNYDSIDQQFEGESILTETSDKVYKTVKFADDDTEYTASNFGGVEADYLFVTELDTSDIVDGKVCGLIKSAIKSVSTVLA